MGNPMVDDLVRKMRSGRITRRHFIQSASALGLSATSISSALRANPARAQDASQVTFWTVATEPDLSALQKIVDNFNSENSDVQAELVQVVGDETDTTKLMTAVRGGTGPDVYMLDRFIVAQRAAEGVLQDLSEFMGGEDFSEVYIPFSWAEANFNGKPYALPFDTDARALFYNRGMIQEAGIDPAELDVANGPITFARLTEIANQINETDADGNFSRMGFVPYTHQGWHYTYGFAFGGTFFDEAACEVTPDNEGVVAGHKWLYDYVAALNPQKVNAFAGPQRAGIVPAVPEEQQFFITQRVAFTITGNWYLNSLPKYAPDIEFGMNVMPVPAEGDESATWAGGWSVVIPQGAKNPEGAWRFMQYIAGEPGQRSYVADIGNLPTISSLLQDDELLGDEQHIFFAQTLLPTAKNRPPLPVGVRYWDELTSAWERVFLNQEEPAAALATVKERVQPDLEGFCPIKMA
jgi:multiple sugar transport system substrate-binding protein